MERGRQKEEAEARRAPPRASGSSEERLPPCSPHGLLPAAHKALKPGQPLAVSSALSGGRGAGTEDCSSPHNACCRWCIKPALDCTKLSEPRAVLGQPGSQGSDSSQCPPPRRGWASEPLVREPGLHAVHHVPGDVTDRWMHLELFLEGRGCPGRRQLGMEGRLDVV